MPLLFIIWLLSFFDYYFKNFREGTREFLSEILLVTYKKNISLEERNQGFVFADISSFEFTVLPQATIEGFSLNDLDFLKSKWHICAVVNSRFTSYEKYLFMFKWFILGSFVTCWFILSYSFFWGNSSTIEMTFPFLFRKSMGFGTKQVFILRSPREVWFVKEGKSMNHVKVASGGAVSPGHPVIGEVEGTDLRVDVAVTHGSWVGYLAFCMFTDKIDEYANDNKKYVVISILQLTCKYIFVLKKKRHDKNSSSKCTKDPTNLRRV